MEDYLGRLRSSFASRFPVVTADIANGAVTTLKLADQSVTAVKLAPAVSNSIRRVYASISARDTDTTARVSAGAGPVTGEVCYVSLVASQFGVANRDAEYIWNGSAWTVWEFPVTGTWPDFVPTLTQGVGISFTPTAIRFKYLHRIVHLSGVCSIASGGTAGQVVKCSLPVTSRFGGGLPCGSGSLYDASVNIAFAGMAYLDSTTLFAIQGGSGAVNNGLGASGFTAAVASGDAFTFALSYEANA